MRPSSEGRKVTDDWFTALPREKSQVFEAVVRRWECAYAMMSVALDGALSLAHSSGDASMDAATRIAIAKAAPFAPLPQKFAKPVAQLRVTIAYDHPRAPTPQPGGTQ